MKPFAVVRWNDDEIMEAQRRVVDEEIRRGLNGRVFMVPGTTGNLNKAVDHPDSVLWFFSTKNEAEAFAEWIAKKYPDQDFIVLASTMLVVSKPGVVSKATISEKGILPV